MAEFWCREVIAHAVIVREFTESCIDALVVLLDFMDFACDAQEFLRNARQIACIMQGTQFFIYAITVVCGHLGVTQGLLEFKDLFVEPSNQHGQTILFPRFMGKMDFCDVELREKEETQDEEAAQEGDAGEPGQHREIDDSCMRTEEEIHGIEFNDTGNHFGTDGIAGNLHGLCCNRHVIEAHGRKAGRINEVVEKGRDMQVERGPQAHAPDDIEQGTEQYDGDARAKSGDEHGDATQPEQEKQKERRAEAHAEILEIAAKGMDLRLTCQGNDDEHADEDEQFPMFAEHDGLLSGYMHDGRCSAIYVL